MMNKRWLITAVSLFLIVILIAVGLQFGLPSLSAKSLTEEEANKAALAKYPGEIVTTSKSQGEYHITMQLDTGIYHIKINEKNGDVLSVTREEKVGETPEESNEKQLSEKEVEEIVSSQGVIQSIELKKEKERTYYQAVVSKNNEMITLNVDPSSGTIIDSKKETARIITENEAIKIAEDHVKGTVDDVDFYHPSDQIPYYLIEVEVDDEREGIVQVDAYTGKVKSVTWEDHDDNDDSDEN